MSGENQDTNTDILEARYRAKRNQSTLNIEIALAGGVSGGGGSSAGGVSGGGSVGGSPIIIEGGGGGGSPPCFIGGTLILMPDWSERRMWQVNIGEYVKAPDENGEIQDGRVVTKWEHEVWEYLVLIFENGETTVTRAEHKYRCKDGVYRPAEEITETIHWADDAWNARPIKDKKVVKFDNPTIMYNFEIETFRSYIANGDWVSNAKPNPDQQN